MSQALNYINKCIISLFLAGCIIVATVYPSGIAYSAAPQRQYEINEALQSQLNAITTQTVTTIPSNDQSVQVFDVKQGHVVKSVANSSKIQKQTARLLQGITEFAPEVQPDMKAKYIIRIPVQAQTSITINNHTISIGQLFVFYYENKGPLILVFDENKHPFLFHTSYSIEPLLKLIQLN